MELQQLVAAILVRCARSVSKASATVGAPPSARERCPQYEDAAVVPEDDRRLLRAPMKVRRSTHDLPWVDAVLDALEPEAAWPLRLQLFELAAVNTQTGEIAVRAGSWPLALRVTAARSGA
jgi:hypothetical protein